MPDELEDDELEDEELDEEELDELLLDEEELELDDEELEEDEPVLPPHATRPEIKINAGISFRILSSFLLLMTQLKKIAPDKPGRFFISVSATRWSVQTE